MKPYELEPPHTAATNEQFGGAKVQHVYSLNVAQVSERLDVSQEEFLDGIARDHVPVALQTMLHTMAAHDADSFSPGDDDDGGRVSVAPQEMVCREACLLLLDNGDGAVVLQALDDGRTVLAHLLQELFQPNIIEHLVICVPKSHQRQSGASASSVSRIKKIATRLCAIEHVHMDFVLVETSADKEKNGEIHALRLASTYLKGAVKKPSAGFLVLRGNRIFDAPTIQMMTTSPSPSPGSQQETVTIRALIDLDVQLPFADSENDDDDECASAYAGLFAVTYQAWTRMLMSKPTVAQSTMDAFLIDYELHGDSTVVIDKLVASDYCNWRTIERDSNQQETHAFGSSSWLNQKQSQQRSALPISSSGSSSLSWDEQKNSPLKQSESTYYEFPRETCGYVGFKVATTHATQTTQPEPIDASRATTHTIAEATCSQESEDLDALLREEGVQFIQVDGEKDIISWPEERSEADENADEVVEEEREDVGAETTMLTEADVNDAMRHLPDHAFLFQLRPEPHHLHPFHDDSASDDNDELILALPEPPAAALKVHPQYDHQFHQRRRRPTMRLPSAVQEIKVEAVMDTSSTAATLHGKAKMHVNVTVYKQVPLVGYVILLTALAAISSQGAVQDLLVGVPPLLKVFWRMTGASLAFAPCAALSLWQNGGIGAAGFARLTHRKLALFALCGVCYTVYNATFLVALSLTSVGHAYIFSNCHSLLMVLAKFALRQPLGMLELLGASIGFSGAAITTMDRSNATGGHQALSSTLGDMVAFAGAFAGVGYLLAAKRVRPCMDVFVFMFALVSTVALLTCTVLIWRREAMGIAVFSTHPTHGFFGWVHHLGIEAYVVLVGSFAGTMGFINSLQYFDPLVVSVTMLTEPIVATVISIAIGVDGLPGLLTFLGGFTMLVGCLFVMLASHKTSTKVDISDALVVPRSTAYSRHNGHTPLRRRHSIKHMSSSAYTERSFHVNYGSFP
uniref:Uncharacterized protein n=1 Tax=Globisporangium ultimum (strain ATCC 200006 / CBS 805.95 / DAOM BR144) TaxID=431595 RepID=K3WAE1_GLOUD